MRGASVVVALALGASGLLAMACGSDDGLKAGPEQTEQLGAPEGSNDIRNPELELLPDPLQDLSKGREQLTKVCSRGQQDKVTRSLCNDPSITSVEDLQRALGLAFVNRGERAENGGGGNPAFALLAHSTSLVAREVSAINPRAFVFTPPPGRPAPLPGYVVMGFARGEPFVEIAAEDPATKKLTFYLVKFEPACEATHSCKAGDLLTPAIEKNWKSWSLYDDEDLKNTLVDCRHCHQPGGPSSRPMLRMQEIEDPWTHWLHGDRAGGSALLADYQAAHGEDEDYFGIPGSLIRASDGRAMEDLVAGQGFAQQPNVFDSPRIEREVSRSARNQPAVNVPRGESPTWQRLYDASVSGRFIPPPYHDVKVTDADKLAFATDAYRKVREGTKPASELPDIRRVFLDAALEGMTMRPKAGASGQEILVQTCAQCHHPGLDSSLSRARFDVTQLATMPRAMKDAAIARLELPASDRRKMPPSLFRTLPDDARARAIAELRK